MGDRTRIELARESEAADLERFVDELGLHARRDGTVVEIFDASDAIGNTVTAWLAEWHEPLVPTELENGALALRPPAA
ncbi:MAG TPA: hypothetical protein VF891_05105 [Gaiellaceae bacterium]